jgi:hypothetical protein
MLLCAALSLQQPLVKCVKSKTASRPADGVAGALRWMPLRGSTTCMLVHISISIAGHIRLHNGERCQGADQCQAVQHAGKGTPIGSFQRCWAACLPRSLPLL